MKRILVPTRCLDDWRELLAKRDKHWRDGYSAKELARRWEAYAGLPPEIEGLLTGSGVAAFEAVELLAAFPEWQTALEGRGQPSHTDLLALVRARDGLAVIAIEGKAGELFGPTVKKWLAAAAGKSENKRTRLAFLQNEIGLADRDVDSIRYQLLHRSASAVIEAQRFHAPYAAMIVHSFAAPADRGGPADSFKDYGEFLRLYRCDARPGELVKLCTARGVQLFSGWAVGKAADSPA